MNFLFVRLLVWVITLAVFPIPATLLPRSFQVEVLQCISLDALPQERALVETEQERTERVLAYLENAGKKEIDPWLRDDIRIAWITAKWSQHGVPEWSWHRNSLPYVAATYQVLNCHPDEVWPRILAERKAKLGAAYEEVWGAPSVPKKPVQRETRAAREKFAA
jgi:hypothetical protein